MLDIDVKKLVDELAEKVVPQLDPILQNNVQRLLDGLKELLVGRKITITIE